VAEESALATGRVMQINVSAGGVPKLPVERAFVNRFGLEGDRHNDFTMHGGPHRAVCLFAMEVIERLQAEGHPIEPGGAGENLTTWGVEWSLLPIGSKVRVGSELELELASPTAPCATQTRNFSDGNFNRILIDLHPSDSRMYARVLHEGVVAVGDQITVLPPGADSTATDELLLKRLDRAEGKSSVAAWKAARAAGFQIEISEDGDIGMASSRDMPGPAFNQAHGFARLPNLVAMATSFFDRHGTPGWIWMAEEPWEGAETDLTLGIFSAAPTDVADLPPPEGVLIRLQSRDEASRFEGVSSGGSTAGGLTPGTPNPWPRVMSQLALSPARHMFVAEIDGTIIANASLHVSAKTGWMRGATVAPEARGRGIQRALIAARARAAADLGCDLVGASAEPELVSARNLRATGMRQVGLRSAYLHAPAEASST